MMPLRFTTWRATTTESRRFARCVALTVTLTILAGCDLFSGGPGGGSSGGSDVGAGAGASGGATLSVPILGACNGSRVNPDSGGTIRVTKDAAGTVTAKDLIVASSVTSIPDWAAGSGAFENYGLTRVTFGTPSSLVCIGSHAFSNNRLVAATIPGSVTTLGDYAFARNRLIAMVIPNSVTTIGRHAFSGNRLTTAMIGTSVTTLGEYAFGNNSLNVVTIPNSVTAVGRFAFWNNSLTTVTIGTSVTTIGEYAFGNNRLTAVTIPRSVTAVGQRAFAGNTGLTTVTLSQALLDSTPINAFPGGVAFQDHAGGTITR